LIALRDCKIDREQSSLCPSGLSEGLAALAPRQWTALKIIILLKHAGVRNSAIYRLQKLTGAPDWHRPIVGTSPPKCCGTLRHRCCPDKNKVNLLSGHSVPF